MTFAELKTELGARGFSPLLADLRLGQYINRACARLDNMYRWSYRDTLASGAAPLTVADLGQVESVRNTTQGSTPLDEASRADIIGWYGDLTTLGTPYYWYRSTSGTPPTQITKVSTYPVSTDTLSVQYWKSPPVLTGTDTPYSPAKYHLLIVDMAVQMAYRDSDNHAMAESLQVEINRQIFEMLEDLLPQTQFSYQTTGWDTSEDW